MEKFKVYAQEEATKSYLGIRIISSIKVTVSTADVPFAGTDAHVHLNCGSIGDFYMKKAGENDFEKGQTGTYGFDVNCTLGALRSEKIELGHDNTGKLPGWRVANVAIQLKLQVQRIISCTSNGGDRVAGKRRSTYHTTVVELRREFDVYKWAAPEFLEQAAREQLEEEWKKGTTSKLPETAAPLASTKRLR